MILLVPGFLPALVFQDGSTHLPYLSRLHLTGEIDLSYDPSGARITSRGSGDKGFSSGSLLSTDCNGCREILTFAVGRERRDCWGSTIVLECYNCDHKTEAVSAVGRQEHR